MPTFQNEKNTTSPYSRKQGQGPQPSRCTRRSTRSTKSNVDFPVPKSSPFVQSQQNKNAPIETSLSHTGDSSLSTLEEPSSPSPLPAQGSFPVPSDELLISSPSHPSYEEFFPSSLDLSPFLPAHPPNSLRPPRPSLSFSSSPSSSLPLIYPYSPSFSPSSSLSLSPFSSSPFSQQSFNTEIETSNLFLTRVQSGTEPTCRRGEIDNQGRVYTHDDFIRIPDQFLLAPPPPPLSETDKKVNYKNHFLDEIYGNGDPALFETDVILTVDEADAKEYNDLALNKFCTMHKTLSSNFRTTCEADRDNVWEFWDFMRQTPPTGSCLPPLKLKLGVGMPIILLRDVHHGGFDITAGTRLIVIAFHETYILARVPAGNIDQVIIRRQSYRVSSGCSPEIWHIREQFPVKRAFALAADDVPDGVMFEGVGLDLKHPFKRYGKLSTALSRCRDPRRLKVYTPGGEGYTRNARRVE